ncbi:hypothetical protein LWI29_009049 [Acer saccharum]|uniref:Uncharacterized protein n=1 Tax=Acer saccharum TaxID=4024 RepID=A0AA39TDL0_ACESA|nr:hypothetical protein LWI29_009049 [Acer saccharum]
MVQPIPVSNWKTDSDVEIVGLVDRDNSGLGEVSGGVSTSYAGPIVASNQVQLDTALMGTVPDGIIDGSVPNDTVMLQLVEEAVGFNDLESAKDCINGNQSAGAMCGKLVTEMSEPGSVPACVSSSDQVAEGFAFSQSGEAVEVGITDEKIKVFASEVICGERSRSVKSLPPDGEAPAIPNWAGPEALHSISPEVVGPNNSLVVDGPNNTPSLVSHGAVDRPSGRIRVCGKRKYGSREGNEVLDERISRKLSGFSTLEDDGQWPLLASTHFRPVGDAITARQTNNIFIDGS